MSYLKNTCLVLLLIVTFNNCTEIYNPNIISDTKALVVEGIITNEAGPYTIRLTEAVTFSSDSIIDSKNVTGAKLTITDNEDHTYKLTEPKAGNYVTPVNFTPKVGNSYKLHITTKDGNKYESNEETLLPPQTYDSIHVIHATESYMDNNKLQNAEGADVLVDLFKSISKSDVVPACRFSNKITVQYRYTMPVYDDVGNITPYFHWNYFGWRTFNLNDIENITPEKSTSSSPLIKNHSIGFTPFSPLNYGFIMPIQAPLVLYLRVNQYTVNNDSYRYFKTANSQLSASGKLFDPITTQLQGNLRCVSNSSKIILGLFEVSSVMHHAFVVNGSQLSENVSIRKAPVIDIPADKAFSEKVDEINGAPTPLPNWWDHY